MQDIVFKNIFLIILDKNKMAASSKMATNGPKIDILGKFLLLITFYMPYMDETWHKDATFFNS